MGNSPGLHKGRWLSDVLRYNDGRSAPSSKKISHVPLLY